MEKVEINEVRNEVNPMEVHEVRRPVSDALGTDHFAMNYFELEPGESFSGGLHAHHDQEEVFYVQSGEATFDIADQPDSSATESVTVGADEVIRFFPGSSRRGNNDPDDDVAGFAFGAPSDRHE